MVMPQFNEIIVNKHIPFHKKSKSQILFDNFIKEFDSIPRTPNPILSQIIEQIQNSTNHSQQIADIDDIITEITNSNHYESTIFDDN